MLCLLGNDYQTTILEAVIICMEKSVASIVNIFEIGITMSIDVEYSDNGNQYQQHNTYKELELVRGKVQHSLASKCSDGGCKKKKTGER